MHVGLYEHSAARTGLGHIMMSRLVNVDSFSLVQSCYQKNSTKDGMMPSTAAAPPPQSNRGRLPFPRYQKAPFIVRSKSKWGYHAPPIARPKNRLGDRAIDDALMIRRRFERRCCFFRTTAAASGTHDFHRLTHHQHRALHAGNPGTLLTRAPLSHFCFICCCPRPLPRLLQPVRSFSFD